MKSFELDRFVQVSDEGSDFGVHGRKVNVLKLLNVLHQNKNKERNYRGQVVEPTEAQ